MRTIRLEGAQIRSREELHDCLRRKLELPGWYGRNLDALFDCLTGELAEETTLVVTGEEALLRQLGGYGTVFLRVLREAEEENPNLTVLTDSVGPETME